MSPPDADLSQRGLDVVELLAKVAGSLTILGVFIKGIWQPYRKWRTESLARAIRTILGPELKALTEATTASNSCTEQLKAVIEEQRAIAEDHEDLMALVRDNRERHDEIAELLNTVGFSSDRRIHEDRRRDAFQERLDNLSERRRARRRSEDR